MPKVIKEPGKIIIPSDVAYLQMLDEFLEETLRGFGVSESDIADIAISVTELANNAIIHGNKENPEKVVDIRIKLINGAVEIIVSDEGKGFDTLALPDPLTEENLFKENGRGIFIVRSLMDKVDIKIRKDNGTVIKLVKKIKRVHK